MIRQSREPRRRLRDATLKSVPCPSTILDVRRALGLSVLLIAVMLLTPFAGASMYEAWTDGLSDADVEGDLLAATSLQSVVESAPFTSRCCTDMVVAVFSVGNDTAADLTDPSPRTARAPPTP